MSAYELYTHTTMDNPILTEAQWLESLKGERGSKGTNGVTPHIDSTTGHWFIGTTDTGVNA